MTSVFLKLSMKMKTAYLVAILLSIIPIYADVTPVCAEEVIIEKESPASDDGKPGAMPETENSQGGDPANDLLRRLEALEREVEELRASSSIRIPTGGGPSSSFPADQDEQFVQAALERALVERSGLLLPPWELEIEPSLTYVHASSDNITINGFTIGTALVIGEIVSEKVRRDILTPVLTFRLGLPEDGQLEVRVPYRYQWERVLTADNIERSREGAGLGDVEIALSRQLMREKGWNPDLLFSLRWKTDSGERSGVSDLPFGTGFNGVQFMMTALKVRDPVAVFGSLSYTGNLPADKAEGRIDPGDTVGMNLGLALALTPDTSINFGWEQQFVDKTKLNGQDVPGSFLVVGGFRVGGTYTVTPDTSVDVSVVIGLTRDAPDLQATIALPVRF